jgi:hypothetical protein
LLVLSLLFNPLFSSFSSFSFVPSCYAKGESNVPYSQMDYALPSSLINFASPTITISQIYSFLHAQNKTSVVDVWTILSHADLIIQTKDATTRVPFWGFFDLDDSSRISSELTYLEHMGEKIESIYLDKDSILYGGKDNEDFVIGLMASLFSTQKTANLPPLLAIYNVINAQLKILEEYGAEKAFLQTQRNELEGRLTGMYHAGATPEEITLFADEVSSPDFYLNRLIEQTAVAYAVVEVSKLAKQAVPEGNSLRERLANFSSVKLGLKLIPGSGIIEYHLSRLRKGKLLGKTGYGLLKAKLEAWQTAFEVGEAVKVQNIPFIGSLVEQPDIFSYEERNDLAELKVLFMGISNVALYFALPQLAGILNGSRLAMIAYGVMLGMGTVGVVSNVVETSKHWQELSRVARVMSVLNISVNTFFLQRGFVGYARGLGSMYANGLQVGGILGAGEIAEESAMQGMLPGRTIDMVAVETADGEITYMPRRDNVVDLTTTKGTEPEALRKVVNGDVVPVEVRETNQNTIRLRAVPNPGEEIPNGPTTWAGDRNPSILASTDDDKTGGSNGDGGSNNGTDTYNHPDIIDADGRIIKRGGISPNNGILSRVKSGVAKWWKGSSLNPWKASVDRGSFTFADDSVYFQRELQGGLSGIRFIGAGIDLSPEDIATKATLTRIIEGFDQEFHGFRPYVDSNGSIYLNVLTASNGRWVLQTHGNDLILTSTSSGGIETIFSELGGEESIPFATADPGGIGEEAVVSLPSETTGTEITPQLTTSDYIVPKPNDGTVSLASQTGVRGWLNDHLGTSFAPTREELARVPRRHITPDRWKVGGVGIIEVHGKITERVTTSGIDPKTGIPSQEDWFKILVRGQDVARDPETVKNALAYFERHLRIADPDFGDSSFEQIPGSSSWKAGDWTVRIWDDPPFSTGELALGRSDSIRGIEDTLTLDNLIESLRTEATSDSPPKPYPISIEKAEIPPDTLEIIDPDSGKRVTVEVSHIWDQNRSGVKCKTHPVVIFKGANVPGSVASNFFNEVIRSGSFLNQFDPDIGREAGQTFFPWPTKDGAFSIWSSTWKMVYMRNGNPIKLAADDISRYPDIGLYATHVSGRNRALTRQLIEKLKRSYVPNYEPLEREQYIDGLTGNGESGWNQVLGSGENGALSGWKHGKNCYGCKS